MSFAKHLKTGIKYILDEKDEFIQNLLKTKSVNIENEYIKEHYPKLYRYAHNLLIEECKQSCEALYHNLNTLESRAGSQVPFTSINIGRDTTPEGRLVTKSILEASINGIGKFHRTSIFPISIFQLKKGINKDPGDPNYDLKQLALKSMSMRIYPNWCNCDWSQAHEDDNDIDTYFATMGALAGNEHLYISINNNEPIDISIKDLFEMVIDKNNNNILEYDILDKPGIYKITNVDDDTSIIKFSRNIKKDIKNNYKYTVLEYTEDMNDINKYIVYGKVVDNYDKSYKINDINTINTKPNLPQDTSIPQTLINIEHLDIKVFDRNNQWVKIKHIFKNDKLNSPAMMKIEYDNRYSISCTEDHPLWNGKQFIRADEFKINDKLYDKDNNALTITNIGYYTTNEDSYDIGTVTGTFIGSDIMMHNCRTLMGYDRHGLGYKRTGRGNNVPNTIILPKIAIDNGICLNTRNKPDLDGFWKDLDKALRICEQGLLERYALIKKQSPKAAPFMYNNNTIADADKCKETVEEAVKHNTLGIGLIGIAEMCKALFGKTHDEDEEIHKFALSVVDYISKYAKEASERNNLNFGVYFTPAESLCHTALKALREQYGIIEDVTSHEYLTNSCHVPVWHKVSIYDKLKCEAPFTKYATSGCITYIELESTFVKNLKAVEDIIDYACELDIPYLAFNFPIDTCLDCGYQGEFSDHCPECGSKNIEQLRRVTGCD